MIKNKYDIWKDPNVKAALKEGRTADDIMVIDCPKCGHYSYYNEGSSFTCRFCRIGWRIDGDEDGFEPITLADTCEPTPDVP